MIKVSDTIMRELCSKYDVDSSTLTFLGGGREDSDGAVYTCNEGRNALKVLALPATETNAFSKMMTQIKWSSMLGEHGITCGCPIRNTSGNLFESFTEDKYIYIAYMMNFIPGKYAENNDLTDDFAKHWGELTGKTHTLTKAFTKELCGGVSNTEALLKLPGFESEINFFANWCKDESIKVKWNEIRQELRLFPIESGSYGFIHNDNHQRNILVNGTDITLIDFDCATSQFFLQDIITPAQGLMFDTTGGMIAPLRDCDRLKAFIDSFINGYERSNHLDNEWYSRMNIFFNYRRLLLYTCMQDWVCSVPELHKGFVDTIMNPPKIV